MSGSSRHLARRAAIQALYQWEMTQQPRLEIEKYFLADDRLKKTDNAYFQELVREIPRLVEDIDSSLLPYIDRDIALIDPIEKAVLRLAAYELIHHAEIPYRVVLNEAIELSRTYGSDNGYRFVNGILDKMGAEVRSIEAAANQ
ncbi:MAG: N utilization substance protein B [bacterium]|nr:MAG: N utilization substance protein B [bacterium]HEC26646.1 transcription antitermination factor NusB [Gammaproteobacteria bacterium]